MSLRTRMPSFALAILLTLAALLPAAAPLRAQVEHPDQITYPPLPKIEIPTPERVVLDNGMVVMLIEDHELPLVKATALIKTGERYDPADKIGLGSLAGEVLRTGGTENLAAADLDDFLESRAATIESSTQEDSGRVTMSCLKGDLPDVLKVFADVLRHPAYAQDRIDVALTSARADVSRQNDQPQTIVFRELRKVVYGADSPYAEVPTYATLAAISRQDLVDWHARYFHPDRVILGLVGDFDSAQVLEQVRQVFGDWPKSDGLDLPKVGYRTEPTPGVFVADKGDVTQTNIAMGTLGIRRDDPDYYAARVLNEVLSGSMTSRLMAEVRTKRGLAYGVTGRVGTGWDRPGMTLVWTSTKAASTDETIQVLLDQINAVRGDRPPTAEEVAEAKNALLSSFVFGVDSRADVLNQQLTLEYFGYPLDRIAVFRDRIDAVTVDDVRRVAREDLHPDQFSIVVVGPTDQFGGDLSKFGTVHKLDISIPQPPQERAEVTEESAAKAGKLLDAAVTAAGGADHLAAVQALETTSQATLQTPMGKTTLTVKVLRVYPGELRQELDTPMGQMVMVVAPDDAFMVTPQGTVPMPGSRADRTRKDLWRDPLSLLKAYAAGGDDVSATATGSDTVDGTAVELVEVAIQGTVTTAAIDPANGHVVQLRYQDTGPQGAPGAVQEDYSDFREVDGLTYPFQNVTTFNGEEVSSVAVQDVAVNPEVPEGTFARPDPAD